MPTQLLTTGSTAANSSELVVADGATVTVCLKGLGPAYAEVGIFLKDDAAAFHKIGELNTHSKVISITAPGTYRFARPAGITCGVFSA